MERNRKILSSLRWNLLFGGVFFLLGIASIVCFLSLSAIGWRSLALFFSICLTLEGIFRTLVFNLSEIPQGHSKRLISATALLSSAIYYAISGKIIVFVVFSWWLIVLGALGFLSAIQGIIIEGRVLRGLLKRYKKKTSEKYVFPFVFVLAESGLGVWFGNRLITKTICSLVKHRYFSTSEDLILPQFYKHRHSYLWKYRYHMPMAFLISESVRRYPIEFQKWLTVQASAFVVVRTAIRVHESLERNFDERNFDERAEHGYRLSPGPTFMVYLRSPIGDIDLPEDMADHKFDCIAKVRGRHLDAVIAPLVDRLASTAFPTAVSDIRLSENSRYLIQEIASSALPPLADCYLRFRLAKSHVERFICLLDGIECLIKCSVLFMLVEQWIYFDTNVNEKMLTGKPTLGSWVKFLRTLVAHKVPSREVYVDLCSYWGGHISEAQNCLIEKAIEKDLPLPRADTMSRLDWLKQFTDLRNVTKGHGTLTEESIISLWHPLHEIFLEMISDLRPLTLSSVLGAKGQDDKWIPLRGWFRGGRRVGSETIKTPVEHYMPTTLKLPSDQLIPLYPLVIIQNNRVLLWDHSKKSEGMIEFLDYTSGNRHPLPCSEFTNVDPYKVWKLSSQSGQGKLRDN